MAVTRISTLQRGGPAAAAARTPEPKEVRDCTAPRSLLLVHGAGSEPSIYQGWAKHFRDNLVQAIDLQATLDVARASMDDYAERVITATAELPQPLSLCGWSMGGLVVMLAALRLHPPPHSIVLIEPSLPAEIQGFLPQIDTGAVSGTFDPEAVYGRFPAGISARPESALARAERKRGISVPSLPCRILVIYGYEFADERGRRIAKQYRSEEHEFASLNHWGLIRDHRVRERIRAFLCSESQPVNTFWP